MTAPEAPVSSQSQPDDPSEGEVKDPGVVSRRRAKKRWRRTLTFYFFILPPILLVSFLPLSVARALGDFLGTLGYIFASRERKLAMKNLQAALPERSLRELKKICRSNFRHVTCTILEFLIVHRWSFEKVDRAFGLGEDFRRADKSTGDNGCLIVAGHYGNWELLAGIYARYFPEKIVAVSTTYPNHKIHEFMEKARQAFGMEMIYTEESPRRFLQAIRNGKTVGVLPDQNLRAPSGIFVPFFGRPAYTTTLPANLTRTLKAPLFVALLERKRRGFKLHFTKVFDAWTNDREADLLAATEAWSRELEARYRERPEQWVWFHNRWLTQPGEEKKYVAHRWVRKQRKE